MKVNSRKDDKKLTLVCDDDYNDKELCTQRAKLNVVSFSRKDNDKTAGS
jgi:hypothetical protein